MYRLVKMSPRSYRLGRREAGVADTRARIVAATRELLARGDARGLTIDEVARRADVARATIYYQFRSRRGLVEAIVEDVQQRAGQHEIARAVELADPAEALRATFSRGCRFWSSEHVIVRVLTGLAAVDAEIREVVIQADENRLTLMSRLVERLDEAGRLRAGCSRTHAANVLWALSSFELFDQLCTRRGLAADDVAAVLVDLAGRLLS